MKHELFENRNNDSYDNKIVYPKGDAEMMKQKYIFWALIAVAVLAFSGCGGGGSTPGSENIAAITGGVSSLSLSVRVDQDPNPVAAKAADRTLTPPQASQLDGGSAKVVSALSTVRALGVTKISIYIGLSTAPIEKVIDVTADSGSATITEIPAQMNVPVSVKAMDSSGTVLYSGSTTVDFVAGQTASATVILKKIFDLFGYLPFTLGNKWYYTDHYEEVTSTSAQFGGMTAIQVTGFSNSGVPEYYDYYAFSGDNFLVLGSIDYPDQDAVVPDSIGPEQFMYGYRATYSPPITISRFIQTGYTVSATISVLLEPYDFYGSIAMGKVTQGQASPHLAAKSDGTVASLNATVSMPFNFTFLGTSSVTGEDGTVYGDCVTMRVSGEVFGSGGFDDITFAKGVGQVKEIDPSDPTDFGLIRGAVIGGVSFGNPSPGAIQGSLNWSSTPGDQQVEYGQMFEFQVYAYSQTMPIAYTLSVLGGTGVLVINPSTGFISSQTGGYNSMGATTFRLTATDAANSSISHDFTLTGIQDSTPPTWVMAPPASLSLNEGDSLNIPVSATDPSGVTITASGPSGVSFDTNTNSIVSSSTLPAGSFSITVVAVDGFGNPISATISVTVVSVSVQPPVFDSNNPVNLTAEFGVDLLHAFTASDPGGLTPIDFGFGSTVDTNYFCIDPGTGEFCTLPGVPVGTYALVITATNTGGAIASFSFTLLVEDTTLPTWSAAPVDTTVELGGSLNMPVSATDLSGVTYSVSGPIAFAINTTTGQLTSGALGGIGNYTLVVSATDAHGNALTQSIVITVSDTTPPSFDSPLLDPTFEYGSAFTFFAAASDPTGPVKYYVSDTTNFIVSNQGTGQIAANTTLAVGSYPLTITIEDSATPANSATGSITVYIEDTTKPVWTATPFNATLDPGSSYSFKATASDLAGIGSYLLYDSGTGISPAEFTVDSVTGDITNTGTPIPVKVYNLEIKATDLNGNFAVHAFVLTVSSSDTVAPTWVKAPQTAFSYEIDGLGMDIEATDDSGGQITYTLNDTTYFMIVNPNPGANLVYIRRTPANSSLSTPRGVNVTATDPSGNPLGPVALTITLTDGTPPVWLSAPPAAPTFVEGDTGWSVMVQAQDASTSLTYSLSGTHAANFGITQGGVITQVGSLVSGIYNVTVRAQDASGNVLQTPMNVSVTAP